jgi:hypothetical protein
MAMGDAVGDQPLTLRIIGEGRDSHFAL